MPEPVKKSNIKIAQTISLHWMEEAHLIMCLAWVIGLVMVIFGNIFSDNTMFWIGGVIWGLTFAMRGLECILKCLPKSRAQDRCPTNSRTTDEGTNWTLTLDPTPVPRSQEDEDEEPPKYEDVERQDALHLPNYHDCFRLEINSPNLAKTTSSLTSSSAASTPT